MRACASSDVLAVYLLIGAAMFLVGSTASVCPYQVCTCSGTTIDCHKKGIQDLILQQNFSSGYTHLYLDSNDISFIRDGDLPPGLEYLDLRNNPIRNIADSAFRDISKTMQTIRLSRAAFTQLPTALRELGNLRELDLEGIDLTSITITPSVVYELVKSVTSLRLNNVSLTYWPSWLPRFRLLTKLDLSHNNLGNIPDNALAIWDTQLTDLSLDNTGATQINALEKLRVLRKLSMSNNHIDDHVRLSYSLIPIHTVIESIDLNFNALTQLPRFGSFDRLSVISFVGNKLSQDNQAAFPASLTDLNLFDNQLTRVPDSIKKLTKLKTLDIRRNAITRLGSHAFPVNSSLHFMYLGNNPISVIEENAFDDVPNVSIMTLDNTTLTELPLALTALVKLRVLNMDSNPHLMCSCNAKAVIVWISNSPDLQVHGRCNHVDIKHFIKNLLKNC